MKLELVLLMCVTSTFAARVARWVNAYDGPLNFQCTDLQSIGSITSHHDDKYEDRVWDFSCKDTFSEPASCFWSSHANDFNNEIDYVCPPGSVLSGMSSYHDNEKEDRRWRFWCCKGDVNVGINCLRTGFVNNFDQYLKWSAPSNGYLVGTYSYHDNTKQDRRWGYYTCQKG